MLINSGTTIKKLRVANNSTVNKSVISKNTPYPQKRSREKKKQTKSMTNRIQINHKMVDLSPSTLTMN